MGGRTGRTGSRPARAWTPARRGPPGQTAGDIQISDAFARLPPASAATENFPALAEAAETELAGPPLDAAARAGALLLWRLREPHDWFRWQLCRRNRDWSKPLLSGLAAAWLVLLCIGAFSGLSWYFLTLLFLSGLAPWCLAVFYFGGPIPGPPPPTPGPFLPGPPVRAWLGLYPAGFRGRTLARARLLIPVLDVGAAPTRESEALPLVWRIELVFPEGLPAELAALARRQEAFRQARGDAPAMRAICEILSVSRRELDRGAHPLRLWAWAWTPETGETFGRPDGLPPGCGWPPE